MALPTPCPLPPKIPCRLLSLSLESSSIGAFNVSISSASFWSGLRVRLCLLSLGTAGMAPEMEPEGIEQLTVGPGAADTLCDLGKVT